MRLSSPLLLELLWEYCSLFFVGCVYKEFDKVSQLITYRLSATMCVYAQCRKGWHSTVGHSSYNRVWPWNWYSRRLLLCEEQERYVVY